MKASTRPTLANIYLFKVNSRNIRKKMGNMVTVNNKGVFIVNFERISQHFLGFLLLTLNR